MEPADGPVTLLQVLGPEEFTSAVRGADLEPVQLSPNPSPSLLARVQGPRVCLDFVEIGPSMLFTGVMPADCYTLMFVTRCPDEGHSFNFGTDHTDGYMGIFPPGGALDASTPEGYANATLTIPVEVFLAAIERYCPDIPDEIIDRGAAIRIGAPEQTQLRVLLSAVMEAIKDPRGPLSSVAARSELESMLLESFLGALQHGAGDRVPSPNRRFLGKLKHLRQAREFIDSSSHERIRLEDVSAALGMSERGIEALFRGSLGIGPNAFIRHQRLHGVRRALLETEPRIGLVKELALEWGFWHMGHFSHDYRALFGECPTSTLMRHQS